MIEAAEEQCCDAWVVTRGTAVPRRYSEAILETVDFIAERRCRVPPLGTGLGQLPFLGQRLIWIMRGPRRQDFSRVGRVLCVTLAVRLPFQPTWLATRRAISAPATVAPDTRFEGGSILESPATPAGAPELPDSQNMAVIATADISPETSRLADSAVPELPLNFLVSDAARDEQAKSLWDELTKRAAVFKKPIKPSKGSLLQA